MTILTSAANQAGAALATTPDLDLAFHTIINGKPLPEIPTRPQRAGEAEEVRGHLRDLRTKLAAKYARAGRKAGTGADAILGVLASASIRKQRIRFDNREAMRTAWEAADAAVRRGASLRLVLPIGGGKAANPLKTGQAYLPDLSEHLAATMLAAIADAITEVHSAGAHIHMIPDAGLHSDDLGFSATEHRLHLRAMRQDLIDLGVHRQVSMADSLAHLPSNWVDEVTQHAADARARIAADPAFAAEVEAQVQSLRFSMNLRTIGWTDAEAVEVTTALVRPEDPRLTDQARARAAALLDRTRGVTERYVGTNHALRSLDLPGRIVGLLTGSEAYLRMTVHAKPGEPRPALVPSSRLARPGLLPMHGVGVLERTDKVRIGAFFHLEARMRGFRAVTAEDGRVWFYESAEGRAEGAGARGRGASSRPRGVRADAGHPRAYRSCFMPVVQACGGDSDSAQVTEDALLRSTRASRRSSRSP